ncbi:unnamed protein product [Musa acuminata subsp. malaccensis]|uniref:Ninja-family protein n=1 Tax=Musa acuminata subsp. malaccensis TaxID=214687 RepID=A0A804JLQ8_MUSAM|nr:PREDICTED: ninja-family protein AFP3-like [Musa acuminata subsp. malaccensis]CAG1847741.1 unnamed protein product [Musa acuminata subsp. malaccensis]
MMEVELVKGEAELERQSSVIESFPRDLLRRLSGNNCFNEQREVPSGESDEVELNLNLGLSLGGCLGVDPRGKKLIRSSSIASFSSLPWEHEFSPGTPTMVRTSSLPTETEEKRRKMKELQGLRRLEAKRKRLEKRKSIKSCNPKSDVGMDGGKSLAQPCTVNGRLSLPIGSQFSGLFSVATPPGLRPWTSGSKITAAQGSELENQTPARGLFNLPAFSSNADFNDTATVQSVSAHKTAIAPLVSGARITITPIGGEEDPLEKKKKKVRVTRDASLGRNMIGEMPCVSTRGDGPNGRRIEGFLYKYKKGEEVRIVCVCHGSFLTPAEFVKHAGGGDVTHPLRHIVVNPMPSALMSLR